LNFRNVAVWHRWLGLASAPLVVIEAVTVLGLNHQTWIYDRVHKRGPKWLLQLAYNLHDGWFWGQPAGVVITDGVAWVLLALVATGSYLGLRGRFRRGVGKKSP
jgi:uncharacterized iron-regulated membrane protein